MKATFNVMEQGGPHVLSALNRVSIVRVRITGRGLEKHILNLIQKVTRILGTKVVNIMIFQPEYRNMI